jgi:16S rRNA (adenine1518-N6/adenine1519-N6)-dimethyltransferase
LLTACSQKSIKLSSKYFLPLNNPSFKLGLFLFILDDYAYTIDMQIPLSPLRDVIHRHGLAARKSLGQHFLLDSNITAKIARIAGDLNGVHIIEVGPGPGGLTRALLETQAQHIYAIEKDDRCVDALKELEIFASGRLTLIAEDALEFSAMDNVPGPRAVVANLPYNIGTILLIHWLDDIAAQGENSYKSLTLMFQKEVAGRLFASPNSKAYGRLSVMVQWLCDIEHCFDLPASAFTPPPKVDSSVVKLVPLAVPRFPADRKILASILMAAFGQRRKMLRSSLSSISEDAEKWLKSADIEPTRRAETLAVEEFCRLALLYDKK